MDRASYEGAMDCVGGVLVLVLVVRKGGGNLPSAITVPLPKAVGAVKEFQS